MSVLEEFNRNLKDKKIAIIGLGVSNIPLIDYFYKYMANVTIYNNKDLTDDMKDKLANYNFKYVIGDAYDEQLANYDYIFRSPSCLPTREDLTYAKEKGVKVTTEIEMLLELTNAKVIGITGSDGKTTTSTLISLILKASGYNVYLGGNIGTPLFTKLDDIVLELSSFQLMDMGISPDISVITNISPNHLDIHKDYQEYIDAKKNIFKNKENKLLVTNYDNKITNNLIKEVTSKVRLFSSKTKLEEGFYYDNNKIYYNNKVILDVNDLKIKGTHNYENIMAALGATIDLIDLDKAIKAIKDFNGVEHRLELVREINGVKWYNDSVSSSPTRTIAGLKTFNKDIVLIAGGYDKNLDYTPLAEEMIGRVNKVILFGATRDKILSSLNKIDNNIEIYVENTLEDVVNKAYEIAKSPELVLFSPASASFDMFKNFADRGEQFKKLVCDLK